jgi:hypothetical protein
MSWIHRINRLYRPEKEGLYRILIPPSLYRRFGIDPITLCNERREKAVRFFCPFGDSTCLIEMKLPGMEDPIYSLQLTDGSDLTQLQWDFLIVNDPASPKFNTHMDAEGRDTLFGWASRNLEEEQRAMAYGLFPGQIKKGLGLTREVIQGLEFFSHLLDIKTINLRALFYHNAISYEKQGFSYFSGYRQMKRIHELFQPGEKLFNQLDQSTPFRKPEFAQTVRGRSWAIHDGILLEIDDDLFANGWFSPAMYKMIEKPRSMITFPDALY